jgi:hypothetical protein
VNKDAPACINGRLSTAIAGTRIDDLARFLLTTQYPSAPSDRAGNVTGSDFVIDCGLISTL